MSKPEPEKRPMRMTPTWRIPFGMVLMIVGLLAYAGLVARVVGPAVAGWPALGQMPVYITFGLLWLVPMRRFLFWMETGRWK